MITKVDCINENFPLGLRVELANFNWEWDIISELLPHIEERRGKVYDLIDSQVAEVIKIYKWWFSEQVMYSKNIIDTIKEYDWTLRGLLSLSNFENRYEEVDKYLEELLLNNWISYNDIWKFLVYKESRWFYDAMIETIYDEDEDWILISLDSIEENIKLQNKYIIEHLSDILNHIDWIK